MSLSARLYGESSNSEDLTCSPLLHTPAVCFLVADGCRGGHRQQSSATSQRLPYSLHYSWRVLFLGFLSEFRILDISGETKRGTTMWTVVYSTRAFWACRRCSFSRWMHCSPTRASKNGVGIGINKHFHIVGNCVMQRNPMLTFIKTPLLSVTELCNYVPPKPCSP